MNKWQIQPQQWNYLPQNHKQRLFRMAIKIAGPLMILLVMFSLTIEAKLGL